MTFSTCEGPAQLCKHSHPLSFLQQSSWKGRRFIYLCPGLANCRRIGLFTTRPWQSTEPSVSRHRDSVANSSKTSHQDRYSVYLTKECLWNLIIASCVLIGKGHIQNKVYFGTSKGIFSLFNPCQILRIYTQTKSVFKGILCKSWPLVELWSQTWGPVSVCARTCVGDMTHTHTHTLQLTVESSDANMKYTHALQIPPNHPLIQY